MKTAVEMILFGFFTVRINQQLKNRLPCPRLGEGDRIFDLRVLGSGRDPWLLFTIQRSKNHSRTKSKAVSCHI